MLCLETFFRTHIYIRQQVFQFLPSSIIAMTTKENSRVKSMRLALSTGFGSDFQLSAHEYWINHNISIFTQALLSCSWAASAGESLIYHCTVEKKNSDMTQIIISGNEMNRWNPPSKKNLARLILLNPHELLRCQFLLFLWQHEKMRMIVQNTTRHTHRTQARLSASAANMSEWTTAGVRICRFTLNNCQVQMDSFCHLCWRRRALVSREFKS